MPNSLIYCITAFNLGIYKFLLMVRLKAIIFNNIDHVISADQNNTRCGAHLFDSFPACARPILVVSGLPTGENNVCGCCPPT
jgi:hypothetical protein